MTFLSMRSCFFFYGGVTNDISTPCPPSLETYRDDVLCSDPKHTILRITIELRIVAITAIESGMEPEKGRMNLQSPQPSSRPKKHLQKSLAPRG